VLIAKKRSTDPPALTLCSAGDLTDWPPFHWCKDPATGILEVPDEKSELSAQE